jgi:hypothetical protein
MRSRKRAAAQSNGAPPADTRPDDLTDLLDEGELSEEDLLRVAEFDADVAATCERLEAELRQRHPELFDANGQLDRQAVSRFLIARNGGRTTMSRDDIVNLQRRTRAARTPHAP